MTATHKKPKTFGTLKVTEAEYQTALTLSIDNDPLGEAAYQLIRYCRGQIFDRDQVVEVLSIIRADDREVVS